MTAESRTVITARVRRPIVAFVRPFTLLPPALGFLSGGLMAAGSAAANAAVVPVGVDALARLLLGSIAAVSMNVFSNGINQIYDLDIDQINKPERPLPAGTLSMRHAWLISLAGLCLGLLLAAAISFQLFIIVLLTAALVHAYSAPPLRLKRFWWSANVTISIPRGCLLIVAGWSSLRDVWQADPWFIGAVFGVYLLGAATTKDYSDVVGDQQNGCVTLPVRFGIHRSARMIAPFFVVPFLLLPVGPLTGLVGASLTAMSVLGIGLAAWGLHVIRLILRRPEDLALGSNHVSWKHMYLLYMTAQLGSAAAFWL